MNQNKLTPKCLDTI